MNAWRISAPWAIGADVVLGSIIYATEACEHRVSVALAGTWMLGAFGRREVIQMTRTFIRLALMLTALAPLAVPATASADPIPTRVAISQNADYVSNGLINVQLALSCTPGWWYSAQVQVIQPRGFWQVFGNGFVNGPCTGQHQKLAVSVFAFSFPGWQLGNAVASVNACALGCDTATREIRIGLG